MRRLIGWVPLLLILGVAGVRAMVAPTMADDGRELQLAQAPGIDPFAPAAPAGQPAAPRAAGAPRNPDEVKSPIVRSLLEVVDGYDGNADISNNDRDMLREALYNADEPLHAALGEDLTGKVQRANIRRPAFQVRAGRRDPQAQVHPEVLKELRSDLDLPPLEPRALRPRRELIERQRPEGAAPAPAAPAAPPAQPAPGAIDDLFGN